MHVYVLEREAGCANTHCEPNRATDRWSAIFIQMVPEELLHEEPRDGVERNVGQQHTRNSPIPPKRESTHTHTHAQIKTHTHTLIALSSVITQAAFIPQTNHPYKTSSNACPLTTPTLKHVTTRHATQT